MKIISTGTLKGGTGKTSFLFNFGGLPVGKNKVLFIDGNPQFNLTTNVEIDITNTSL